MFVCVFCGVFACCCKVNMHPASVYMHVFSAVELVFFAVVQLVRMFIFCGFTACAEDLSSSASFVRVLYCTVRPWTG